MIEISSEPLTRIEIGATGLVEIFQNVQTILSTIKGTVFLDRTFGVDANVIDSPTPAAMASYRNQIITEIEKQEPRVKVTSLTFEANTTEVNEGSLIPKIKIKIKDGVIL